MNSLIKFENNNVEVIIKGDEVLFELYSVGQALGYERANVTGKMYPRKSRIDEIVKNNNIRVVTKASHTYLSESQLYKFIMKSNTETADKFMDWVTEEVLPSIRQNGAYVSNNITNDQEKALKAFSVPRFRKTTFLTCPIEKLQEAYQDCFKYHKRKSAREKIRIKKEIVKVLEERKSLAINNGSAPLALLIAEEIKIIQKDITATSNRSNGAKLSKQNREIILLQDRLYQLEPSPDEWHTVEYHPFTVNCCTMAVGDRTVSTSAYTKWKREFPVEQLPENQFNFNNPIYIWLEFDHESKLDVANLHKTFIDKLCSYYGVDDQFVQIMRCTTRKYVDKYSDGKIHFVMREGTWQ